MTLNEYDGVPDVVNLPYEDIAVFGYGCFCLTLSKFTCSTCYKILYSYEGSQSYLALAVTLYNSHQHLSNTQLQNQILH